MGHLFVSIALILAIASGCAPLPTRPAVDSRTADRYRAAVADAVVAEPEEVVATLTPVVPANEDLIWRDGRVLMVTWTAYEEYPKHVGGQKMVLGRDVWTTAVPELQNRCREFALAGEVLELRLEQLLGLPPEKEYRWLVSLWVDPDDLFRPSPDPEIADTRAELDFPGDVPPGHRDWFSKLKNSSYGEQGYPWTRLGYTYDWGNPESEVGLSEFVVRSGAVALVESATPPEDYCRP